MPKMHISRSISIDKSASEIKQVLNDFHNWKPWSPWLIAEPTAVLEIQPDGKYYNWKGKRVGSGEMTVLHESADRIDYDLTFLKPWKSQAKTSFLLNSNGSQTKVTWTMDSSLPWFMFWMRKQMEAYVGSDYERGLSMLKEFIEEGKVHSKLEFIGEQNHVGSQYIAFKTETSIAEMPDQMGQEIDSLDQYMADKQELVNGKTFSIYHKWDMVKQRVAYTTGIPVKSIPADLPQKMITGNFPDLKVYTVRHIGKWSHLGNAWSTLYGMQRNKEIKCARGAPPFETYIAFPNENQPYQTISDINFPLKK